MHEVVRSWDEALRALHERIAPHLYRAEPRTRSLSLARGFVYRTAVVDVASRKVLTHKVAITLEACHAREILEQAFARYGVPEIINTDQGSQFTAEEFTHAVLSRGVRLSMDGKGALNRPGFSGG